MIAVSVFVEQWRKMGGPKNPKQSEGGRCQFQSVLLIKAHANNAFIVILNTSVPSHHGEWHLYLLMQLSVARDFLCNDSWTEKKKFLENSSSGVTRFYVNMPHRGGKCCISFSRKWCIRVEKLKICISNFLK